jgi:hypothetical protein
VLPTRGRGGPGIESIGGDAFVNSGGDPSVNIQRHYGGIPQLRSFRTGGHVAQPVAPLQGKDVDPTTVGRDLKWVCRQGRVSRRPDGLTVSAELVDACNNRQIWGEQYSRGMADVQKRAGDDRAGNFRSAAPSDDWREAPADRPPPDRQRRSSSSTAYGAGMATLTACSKASTVPAGNK